MQQFSRKFIPTLFKIFTEESKTSAEFSGKKHLAVLETIKAFLSISDTTVRILCILTFIWSLKGFLVISNFLVYQVKWLFCRKWDINNEYKIKLARYLHLIIYKINREPKVRFELGNK